MLRLIVLLLMLLNAGYFAWSQDWLRAYGWAPVQQREPERLAQQINPQALTLLTDRSAVRASSAAGPGSAVNTTGSAVSALQCLQSNAFDAAQADLLRPLLQNQFAPHAWQLEQSLPPAHWMLYLGKFASKAEQTRKRAQLTALRLKFEWVQIAELAPGFSLGLFATQKAATDALTALLQRGVRAVQVVQVQEQSPRYLLRLLAADPAQAAIQELRQALPELVLQPCAEKVTP